MKHRMKTCTHRIFLFVLLLFLTIYCARAVLAAVEVEPNNKLGHSTPVPVGESNSGQISASGDEDYFSVTLTSPGRLICSIIDPPSNMRGHITLWNRHADWISAYNYALNDGDDVHLLYDVVEPGTYFIKIHDRDGDSSTERYTFVAAFTPVSDQREPNETIGSASLLTGSSISGTIFNRHDLDWFRIWVEAGSTLALEVKPPTEMVPNLQLYNNDFGWMSVYDIADNPGDRLPLSHTATETGFYYIRLSDNRGLAHTAPYQMTFTGGNPGYVPVVTPVTQETEGNDRISQAHPINLATSVSGTIFKAGDRDLYVLDFAQRGQMTISLNQVPANLKLRFSLLNASGNPFLSAQATNPGKLFSLTYDVAVPEKLYLVVDTVDGQTASSGSYSFTASLVEVNDPHEPNDNYGDATPLYQLNRVQAFFFKTGDQDWYRINVSTPGPLRMILSDLPNNITPEIALFNLSKEWLAGGIGTAAGKDLEIAYSIPVPGTYLIRVNDAGNNDESTDPYTLTIHGGDFDRYAPTARIDNINPGSIIVGDGITFTGSGTDSDGTITGYSWRSSIDGVFGDQGTFSTSALSIGTHVIYFKVQDDEGIWSTEVSEVVYVGSSVSDEIEVNSPIGHANEIALGRPVLAKMNQAGDQDFFKIFIDRPGRLTANVTNVPGNLRIHLAFFNRHMDWISSYTYAGSDGENVTLPLDVVEPGFYYLQVHDRDSEFNADFSYTLTVTLAAAVDPGEPNNSILHSHLLTGPSAQGYIFPRNDHDWYKVWVDGGNTLTVNLTDVPGNLRGHLAIHGRNLEWLGKYAYAENEGDPLQLSTPVTESGYYYIQVHERDGDLNWTDMYTLTASGARPGFQPVLTPVTIEAEPNNLIADFNPIDLNATVTGKISQAGDADWFSFLVPSSGVINARLSNPPAGLRGRMRIFTADGAQIDYRQATNPGDPLMLDTRVTTQGTYLLLIDGLDNTFSADQTYSLDVTLTPARDPFEPNDRFGDATVLKDLNRVQALIFNVGDEDFYRVTSEAGSVLQVTVANVPPNIRPQIEIFNQSMGWMSSKSATNDGQTLIHSQSVSVTADYLIRIRDLGNNSFSTEPYTLIINGAVFASYTPLAFIDTVAPNPVLTGETVTLEGHGEDTNGEIIGYSWRSSLDGELGGSRVITTNSLSTGTHTLYFKVKDSDQNWSPETSTILYVGVSAPREQEPNGQIGDATPMDLGIQYSGVIDPGNDQDFFRIHVPRAGTLTVEASNPTGSLMRTNLSMYNRNADWVSVYTSASNPGDPVTLTWNITEPGNYFLNVQDSNGRAGSEYTVTASMLFSDDPYEPNPDISRAAVISPRETLQGNIFPAGDKDYFRISFDTPGQHTLTLTNMPSNLRGHIAIFGANGEWLGKYTYADNEGDNVTLVHEVPTPGTYFVEIYDRDSDWNVTAPYTLTSSFVSVVDTFEPNHDIRNSSLLRESPVQAYIFPGGDIDFYHFYSLSGATLQIKLDNTPSTLRPQLQIFNGNGTYLGYASAATDGDSVTLNYTAPESGIYFVRVHDQDSHFSPTETYRLAVTGGDLAHDFTVQPVAVDTEPNGDFKSAAFIRPGEITGTFGTAGDNDWYRFEVTEPGILTLTLSVPSNVRSTMKVYDANNAERTSRVAENAGDISRLIYHINDPGSWYVRIYNENGNASTGNYQLAVSFEPSRDVFEPNSVFSSAARIQFGQPVQANIFPNGDRDWFKVNVEEPGLMRLELSRVPGNIQAEIVLHNANNAFLMNVQARNGGDSLQASYHVSTPGVYYVQVLDQGDNAHDLNFYTLTPIFTPMRDQTEPNGFFSQATLLSKENRATGLIYPAGDHDWYYLRVSQPGTLKVQWTQTEGIQPRIELYSDSKKYLTHYSARNKGDVVTLFYQIAVADDYYLLLRDEGDNDFSLQSYSVTVEGGDFITFYPIAAISGMEPNPAVEGTTVILAGSGTDGDGTVAGYEWISDRDGSLGNADRLELNQLSLGTHRISLRVRDNEGNWSAWVYRTLYVTDSLLFESEYNNEMPKANPIPLNEWVIGRTYPGGDSDFYKIYLPQRGYVSAMVDGIPPTMRSHVTFYDGNEGWISRYDYAYNQGERLVYGFFTEPGWYYVKVHEADGRSHPGNYGFIVTLNPSPDPREPNNSIGMATPLPLPATVNDSLISREGDEDWYKVHITERGRLSLSLTDMPANMRGHLALYGTNLEWLSVYNYALNNADSVHLQYDAATPGIYYIQVYDRDNRAHTAPYTLSCGFTPVPDPFESNHDAGHASLLPSDGPLDAAIFPRGDNDWYRVYAPAGSTMNVAVTDPPADMRTTMSIYGPHYDYKTYNTGNNSGDNVYLSYSVAEEGFYYIQLQDANGAAHLAPYHLTVTGANTGYDPTPQPVIAESEPNDALGSANFIQLATNITGTINPATDYDRYRFHVPSPGVLTLSHTGIPTELTSEMWVYNSNNNQVGYRITTNPGEDNVLIMPVVSPGYYQVRVADGGRNNASTQAYTLRVDHAPVVDPNEPNDGFGLATRMGEGSIQGYLFDGSDIDWYRVFITEPTTLKLSLDVVPEALRPRLKIYNYNGSEVGSWVSTNPGVGGNDILTYNVPDRGFYFIRINDEASQYSMDPYTLRVTGADFTNAPVLLPIGDRTIEEEVPYSFTINSRDPDNSLPGLTFSASNLPSGATFNATTRTFAWTPTRGQAGVYTGILFSVSDTVHSDSEAITITVNRKTSPPELAPIGNKTIQALKTLTFVIHGTDPDAGDTLTYSASSLPYGATFDPAMATFSWTPTANQVKIHTGILFTVTDGTRSDFEYIDITVTPTATVPTVTKGSISEITHNGALIAGEVTSDGNDAVIERGIVFSTTSNPGLNDGKAVAQAGGTGVFSVALTNLLPEILYYVRAYATNSAGTGYSEEGSFTTNAAPVGDIAVSPDALPFGTIPVGLTSEPQLVEISNQGSGNLTIQNLFIEGQSPSGFLIQEDACSSKTLGASEHCIVSVTFRPDASGDANASLIIPSNDPDSPTVSVTLSGTGKELIKGDFDNDGMVGLKDAIIVMQVLTGMKPVSEICIDGDVNGDGDVGIADANYILRKLITEQ